jgi:hypothetical protein
MNDQEFLMWLHERLVEVHGESEYVDYMHKLRAIIKNTDASQRSTNWLEITDDKFKKEITSSLTE